MKLQTTRGEIITATLTADHPMSNYGLEVLVDADGNAYGSIETLGWAIERATASERRALWVAGYNLIIDIEREVRR